MEILAIGAHPDDVELSCGGTLAKYASQGHQITMVSVTNGEIGSTVYPPEEIVKIRLQEGQEAAKVIGADYINMGYRDQQFLITQAAREDFIDLLRKVNPDVVFTHYPDYSFSADHTLVGQIVNDVLLLPPAVNIKTKFPAVDKIATLYFFEGASGGCFEPGAIEYVDITDFMETKKKMLSCHKSQDKWLRYQLNTNLFEEAEIGNRYRGLQRGVKYAEAFKRRKSFDRMNLPSTLLP